MIRFGTNANPGKNYTVDDIAEMGAEWTRTILYAGKADEFVAWDQACFERGIEVVPIIVYQSFENYQPGMTRHDLEPVARDHAELLRQTHVHRVFVGNEPNGTGSASWGMPERDFVELVMAYSRALGPLEIIAGCSNGDPEQYRRCIERLDAIRFAGLDPYQGMPEKNWHGWEWTPISDMVDDCYQKVRRPIVIGEIGLGSDPTDPAGGIGEDEQAAYYHDLLKAIAQMPEEKVALAALFCQGDDDVWSMGMQRIDGSRKPSYFGYQQAMREIRGN